MTTMNMVNTVKKMTVENALVSKVTTNRNWVIQTRKGFVYEADKMGNVNPRDLSNSFTDIIADDIRTFFFTYKKDFIKTLTALEQMGYPIYAGKKYLGK